MKLPNAIARSPPRAWLCSKSKPKRAWQNSRCPCVRPGKAECGCRTLAHVPQDEIQNVLLAEECAQSTTSAAETIFIPAVGRRPERPALPIQAGYNNWNCLRTRVAARRPR